MEEQNTSTQLAADITNIERKICETKAQRDALQHELEDKEYTYKQLSNGRDNLINNLHTMRTSFESEKNAFNSTRVFADVSVYILEELRNNAEQQDALSREQLSKMKADIIGISDRVDSLTTQIQYLEEKKHALEQELMIGGSKNV